MDSKWRFGIAIGVLYMQLIAITITTLSTCQELRPSDHGLEYQNDSPAGKKSPEMTTFFKGSSSSSSSYSSSESESSVEQPRAMNSSDTSWWSSWGRSSEEEGEKMKKDHVRKVVLLAVSLVCGVTGVAFLVAAAFVFLFRLRRKRSPSPPTPPSPPSFHAK